MLVFPPITKIIKISMQISPRRILALHADKRAGEEAAALDVIIRKLVGIQRNRNFSPVFAIKGIRIMISVRLNIDPQVYILNVIWNRNFILERLVKIKIIAHRKIQYSSFYLIPRHLKGCPVTRVVIIDQSGRLLE